MTSKRKTQKPRAGDAETGTKLTPEKVAIIDQGDSGADTPRGGRSRPVAVVDIRSAKRLMSRLLIQIQRDIITSEKARLLFYGIQTFTSVIRDSELEQRVVALEEHIAKNKGGVNGGS